MSHSTSGIKNVHAVFSVEQVLKIRELGKELSRGKRRYSANEIANVIEEWWGIAVSSEGVRKILRRETWRHLPDVPSMEELKKVTEVPLSATEQIAMDAMAVRLLKVQEKARNDKLLDELEGKGEGG